MPVLSRLVTLSLLAAATLLPLTACQPGSLGPTKQFAQIDYVHGGTITGIVHMANPAPKQIPIDMAGDPICAMSGEAMTADYVINHGDLANVLVYIKSGLGPQVYPITRNAVVIDQRGCQFRPHVSGAMVGQQVEFTNSDNTLHNVHMSPTKPGNAAFDVSQQANANPITRYFSSPEQMIAVRCNNHPWMHSYLNIMANPFYAVTDDNGHFTIKGLPPGTYTLVAAHEKLGDKSVTITVAANSTAQQQFNF